MTVKANAGPVTFLGKSGVYISGASTERIRCGSTNDDLTGYLREKLVSESFLDVMYAEGNATRCILTIQNKKYWQEVILPGLIDIAKQRRCALTCVEMNHNKMGIEMLWEHSYYQYAFWPLDKTKNLTWEEE